jgi:uncharacterized coiled-coil DUF342 family protein
VAEEKYAAEINRITAEGKVEVEKASDKVAALTGELSGLRATVAGVEKELAVSQTEGQAVRAQLADAVRQRDSLSERADEARGRVAQLESQLEQAERHLREAYEELRHAKAEAAAELSK